MKPTARKEAAAIIRAAFREELTLELGPLHAHRGSRFGSLPSWFAIPDSPDAVKVIVPAAAFLEFACSYEPDVWGAALAAALGGDVPIAIDIRASDEEEARLFTEQKMARRLMARRSALNEIGVSIDAWVTIEGEHVFELSDTDLDTPPEGAAAYQLGDLAVHGTKLTREAQRERAIRDHPSLLGEPYASEVQIIANQFPIGFKGATGSPDRVDLLGLWKDRLLVIELKERSKELDVLAQGLDYILFFRRARAVERPPLNRPTRLILAADAWHPLFWHAVVGMRLPSVVDLDVREWSPALGCFVRSEVQIGEGS